MKGGYEPTYIFRGMQDKFINLVDNIRGLPQTYSSYPWDQPLLKQ